MDLICFATRAPMLLQNIDVAGLWPTNRPWGAVFGAVRQRQKEDWDKIPKEEQDYMIKFGYKPLFQLHSTDLPNSDDRKQRISDELDDLSGRTAFLYDDLVKFNGWPWEYAMELQNRRLEEEILSDLQYLAGEEERLMAESNRPLKKRCLSISYQPEALPTLLK